MINKKILFISTGLGNGGVAKMVHHVAGLLTTEYSNVYAMSVTNSLKEYNNGVQYLEPLKLVKGVSSYLETTKAIRRVVEKIYPDVIVSFTTNVSFLTRVATIGTQGIIIISAERGDPYSLGFKWGVLAKWAFRQSDWCFFQLAKARDFYGKKVARKSYIIPNPAFIHGEIGSHRKERKTIVSVGRFVHEKGFDYLFQAFSIVHEKYPEYKLVLYGSGPIRQELEEQVNQMGLKDYVMFPGKTENAAESLKNEGIFVLPSRLEGMPNALIEALLVGIPTVSSDCNPGGPRFLTDNGKRGLLFPIGDIKAMSQAIIRLIEDGELYDRFEKEGPEIYKLLNPEIIDKLWIKAFKEVTGDA